MRISPFTADEYAKNGKKWRAPAEDFAKTQLNQLDIYFADLENLDMGGCFQATEAWNP